MAVAKNRRRARSKKPSRPIGPAESQAGVAITVAWTLSVTTLVLCELLELGSALYAHFEPEAEAARALAGVAQFCSMVLAIVSLAVLPVVYRVCRVLPPRPFIAFAVVAASVPFVVTVWQVLN